MKKKIIFIVCGVLILLVGFAAGWLVHWNYFKANKERFCSLKPNVQISPEQIQKITKDLNNPKPGQSILGKVTAKQNKEIVLNVQLTNPLNPQDKKEIPVNVSIGSKDEIFRYVSSKTGTSTISALKLVGAAFDDIKINDYLTVKVLQDKKMFFILTVSR